MVTVKISGTQRDETYPDIVKDYLAVQNPGRRAVLKSPWINWRMGTENPPITNTLRD